MISCAIIISHYESKSFLDAAIRQIRKYRNENISQEIIIAEQSCRNTYNQIKEQYGNDTDIRIVWMKALYSGYGLDFIFRHVEVETDYIVQLHSDSFPIADTWISLPVALIEENNFSFVGQLQVMSKPTDTIYYNKKPFFAMAQCYNVAKTKTYKEMSFEAGFTRFHQRENAAFIYNNNDWFEWAKDDYNARGTDDDIVAFAWESNYRDTDKLGLAISGFIQPNFGRIIDDLVFHFCSANESRGVDMGEQYDSFTKRINENYDDALIEEMISLAKKNKPPEMEILTRNYWDGKLKQSFPPTEALNKRIEELKQ